MSPDNETTLRFTREPRDSRIDEFAWLRSAEAEAANEQHIQEMFAEPPRKQRPDIELDQVGDLGLRHLVVGLAIGAAIFFCIAAIGACL